MIQQIKKKRKKLFAGKNTKLNQVKLHLDQQNRNLKLEILQIETIDFIKTMNQFKIKIFEFF